MDPPFVSRVKVIIALVSWVWAAAVWAAMASAAPSRSRRLAGMSRP